MKVYIIDIDGTICTESYLKDGSKETVRLIDRIFIREGKIFRVYQWIGDMQ